MGRSSILHCVRPEVWIYFVFELNFCHSIQARTIRLLSVYVSICVIQPLILCFIIFFRLFF